MSKQELKYVRSFALLQKQFEIHWCLRAQRCLQIKLRRIIKHSNKQRNKHCFEKMSLSKWNKLTIYAWLSKIHTNEQMLNIENSKFLIINVYEIWKLCYNESWLWKQLQLILIFYNDINLDIRVKNGNIVVFSVRGGGQIWQG